MLDDDYSNPEEVDYSVPTYRCWWSSTKRGCSLVNPDSEYLDFNKYGWLYMGGGVLILFVVFGLFLGLCRATTPSNSKPADV